MLEVNNKITDTKELEKDLTRKMSERSIPLVQEEEDDELAMCGSRIARAKHELLLVEKQLAILSSSWNLSEQPIASKHKVFGWLFVFIKKVIRKMTRFLFFPIYERQSEINNATTKSLEGTIKILDSVISELEEAEEGNEN